MNAIATIDYQSTSSTKQPLAARLFRSFEDQIIASLTRENAQQLYECYLTAFRMEPKLQECTADSLVDALVTCAELGLMPSRSKGHIWFLPFKVKGQLQVTTVIGYKGYLHIAQRTGNVKSMIANVVYEDEIASGACSISISPPSVEHRWSVGEGRTKDKIVAAYCVIEMHDGARHLEVLSRAQIDARKASSKTSSFGPWVDHYDRMARKSAVRALFAGGTFPLSDAVVRVMASDSEMSPPDYHPAPIQLDQRQPVADPIRVSLGLSDKAGEE